ncbi:hypothetical protein UFOVP84_196 [uncultured Caudovirales phage]|uniref:Uncharacterized protein n=1 Tax=uncultured Caudovirales phage TaxID=2100421 RepID=A0A6J5L2D8_9CAUD|nr:hypothetical protein UFOVP84_196 [uncultured Caudovirales phage]
MNEQDLLEKIAFNMFVYNYYTILGWSIEWCKSAFETDYDNLKTMHIEMAKIALKTLRSDGEAKQSGVE